MCAKFRLDYYVIVYSHFEEQVLSGTAAHAVGLHVRGGLPFSGGTGVEREVCRKLLMCMVFKGEYYTYVMW